MEHRDWSGEPANWSTWLNTARARLHYPGMGVPGGGWGARAYPLSKLHLYTHKDDANHCHYVNFSLATDV